MDYFKTKMASMALPCSHRRHNGTYTRLCPLTISMGCPCILLRFRLVPFLIELRAVMDWVWTDTTLSLGSWICVEDIYANIFILKCWRESEKVTEMPNCQ